MKLRIVSRTDNVGGYDHNMRLSAPGRRPCSPPDRPLRHRSRAAPRRRRRASSPGLTPTPPRRAAPRTRVELVRIGLCPRLRAAAPAPSVPPLRARSAWIAQGTGPCRLASPSTALTAQRLIGRLEPRSRRAAFVRRRGGRRAGSLGVGCGTGGLTFALPRRREVSGTGPSSLSRLRRGSAATEHGSRIPIAKAMPAPYRPDGRSTAPCRSSSSIWCPGRPAVARIAAWSARRRRRRQPFRITSGGMPAMRMMWDTVAAQDERHGGGAASTPSSGDVAGRDAAELRGAGPRRRSETSVLMRMDYESFEVLGADRSARAGSASTWRRSTPARRAQADEAVREPPGWRARGPAFLRGRGLG